MRACTVFGAALAAFLWSAGAFAATDPYLHYLQTAPEFRRVPPPPKPAGRWDTWLYMPWRYRWTIGTGEAGGRFAARHGINGGVADHGRGPLDWFARWDLRFYGDHTAGKGDLFLRGVATGEKARDPRAVRASAAGPRPLDAALRARLAARLDANVAALRASPLRVAYALDDEISWGSLTRPIPWRVHGDEAAYGRWLRAYYGAGAPPPRVAGPDEVLPQLDRPLGRIDLSPLLDRLSYNDSVWAVLLGDLVARANRLDPETPAGFVGAQAPSAWGGYDYAKLMKKAQFVEAYDLGSAPAIVRSLRPGAPRVTTHFHRGAADAAPDRREAWYEFAHGARGMIGWVEGWFDAGGRPRPWLGRFAPALRELGGRQGKKLAGAAWIHDGVALYYSHPSVQVSWVLDSEAHGRSWVNRNDDHRLGTAALVRRAWERLLTDSGVQFDYLSYDAVAVRGVPAAYRVLILPACWALSDLEARRIGEFAARGGTVVADFAPGLFDQHGRGRRTGALDALFGVRHDGRETRAGFFGGRWWVETDQERGYRYRRLRELFATAAGPLHAGFAVAERRLPVRRTRRVGKGRAVWLNLSPQRYLMHREERTDTAAQRRLFLEPLAGAGVAPWVRAAAGGPAPAPRLETTYWAKGGRTLVFVVQSVEREGGPQAPEAAIVRGRRPLAVELAGPMRDVVDERSGKKLGDGRRFEFSFDPSEAVFFSFAGPPPRRGAG